MAEQIKMNYAMMEEMAQAFGSGAQVLESALAEVLNIASSLESGGLLGDTGDALAEASRVQLANVITRLKDKFEELRSDVLAAKDDMQSSDSTSSGLFN